MFERAFVGRAAELAALTTTFTGPDAPWLLLVDGPAGIGKSRLIAEFVGAARCRVLMVTGTEDARAQPRYLADDIVEQLDESPVDADEAPAAPEFAALDSSEIAPSAPDGADLARRVRRALGAKETLLVVDDLQWSDLESLRLLNFLIRNRPARGFRLLLAFRENSCPPSIARLVRAPRVRTVQVRVPPFTEADVDGLLPGEDPRRRARLLSASHGNPLYLTLLADLPDRELDRALRGEEPDPASNDFAALDRTIRAELAQLPETERLVAQAIAVCGVPPDFELLCATAALPESVVVAAVDGLVGRGVVGVGDGAVTFAHPLIRTAAYRVSGHAWRAMAHRRAALALRARDASMPSRARHLEHALLGADEIAGAELRLAAEQVLADAPAASARWLSAAARVAPATDDPLAEALALGRAQLLSGAAAQAGETLEPAAATAGRHQLEALLLSARCARMLGRVDQARTLLAHGATLPRRPGDGPVQLELAILETQDHQDSEGRARLTALFDSDAIDDPAVRAAATALRCLGLLADARIVEAAQLYDPCDRAFGRLTDTALREVVHAAPVFGWCAYFLDRDASGLRQLDRAIAVSRRFGRTYALAELHTVRAYCLAKLGRLTDAIAAADEATDAATTFHYPDLLSFAGALKLRTLQLTAAPAAVAVQWHTVAALPRPTMRWWRQVVETTLSDTAPALPGPMPPEDRQGPLHPTHLSRAAHAAIVTGDLSTADALITRAEAAAAATVTTHGARPTHIPDASVPIGDAIVNAESPLAADEPPNTGIEPELVSCITGDPAAPDGAPPSRAVDGLGSQVGAAALARADYAAAIGDTAAAAAAAEMAIAAFARAGMVVHRAQAELFAGAIAGRRGDFGQATSRFAAARATFTETGAIRLLDEVTTAQRRLAGAQRVGAPAALTRREREVAELAAHGHTNKAIAEHLYLSPRTVEDHLGRVLRKLGLTGRAGIARRLGDLDGADSSA
ncbi:helix-turn-helix transcriptional regulator [Nocardia salmonicida]|uniref:helix-turn-helix transcriptional regulator n=1 Tax=Nocardia salmonicida TaxID=53431 RepID=UPI0007A50161|nr:LuxR family transcriptional regulator [Nocardia salmonicida]